MCPRVNTWAPQPLSMNIAPALPISILQIGVCNEGGGRVPFSTGRQNASQEPLAAVIGFYTWEPRAAQNSIYRRRKKTEGRKKGKEQRRQRQECRFQLLDGVMVERCWKFRMLPGWEEWTAWILIVLS